MPAWREIPAVQRKCNGEKCEHNRHCPQKSRRSEDKPLQSLLERLQEKKNWKPIQNQYQIRILMGFLFRNT